MFILLALCLVLHTQLSAIELTSLEQQLKKNPHNLNIKRQLAREYLQQRKYSQCSKLLLTVSDQIQKADQLILADCLRHEKRYSEELSVLNQISIEGSKDYQTHYLLGQSHLNNNDTKSAISSFQKSIKAHPKYLPSFTGLLQVFEQSNNRYEQRILLKEMIKKFGDKPQFLNPLCRLYYLEAFFSEVIDTCTKAYKKKPSHPDNWVYLGLAYNELQEPAQAKKWTLTAAKKFPHSELAQWATGQYYFAIPNYRLAIKYYAQAVHADKRSSRSHLGLALSYFALRKYKEAFDGFKQACELDSGHYFEFRKASSKLQQEKNTTWYRKYISASTRCRNKKAPL